MRLLSRLTAAVCLLVPLAQGQTAPGSLVLSGNYQNGQFDSLTFVNSVVGWDMFFNAGFLGASTVIGNVEAGQIWFEHEVFVRPPEATTGFHTYINPAPGSVNQLDYHATMVGNVLAGSGYVVNNGNPEYTYAGLGMAPAATLVSAGIATEFSATDPGSFATTQASVVTPYQAFFQGVGLGAGVARPDVINSSWGGGDPAAVSNEALAIDGLARQNSSVALVVAAGNGGSDAVSFPASGYNNISVGSLGGASFLQPSDYTSRGMTDFYNPKTGVTLTGVRAAVDIAAPGERYFLAAYLGNSGTLGASAEFASLIQQPSPKDLYFLNQDGTSFASPIVAGGIALLKDVAKTDLVWNFNGNPAALDTRVIKSVLMAGAQKTVGWNNGQNASNVTTQALDLQTGAGAMDLVGTSDVYFFGTRDVAGTNGGQIANYGWDSATINLGAALEYAFAETFTEDMTLTVALNWFAVRGFDDLNQTGTDLAFSNLDLQVWLLDDNGEFSIKVGESMSTYNNTEFLRFDTLAAGHYGLRVVFNGMVYDTTNAVTDEQYAMAWRAVAIPEPGGLTYLVSILIIGLRRRRSPINL